MRSTLTAWRDRYPWLKRAQDVAIFALRRARDAWATYLRLEDTDATRRARAERARGAAEVLLDALQSEAG